jgi:hypothetical protein
MTRDEISALLREGVCEVTFTKVNGEQRVMPCTLNEGLLPPAKAEDPASQKKVREINQELVVAYCPDKREWRSFRVANVTDIRRI